jgi:Arc/MetJ-type ribon-helix-helix transcriptional regulator
MTDSMTSYHKLAISLPSKAAEGVRRAVREGRAASVSAYIAQAIEEKAKQHDLLAMLDEMLHETGGPITSAEQRTAELELGIKKRRKRR